MRGDLLQIGEASGSNQPNSSVSTAATPIIAHSDQDDQTLGEAAIGSLQREGED